MHSEISDVRKTFIASRNRAFDALHAWWCVWFFFGCPRPKKKLNLNLEFFKLKKNIDLLKLGWKCGSVLVFVVGPYIPFLRG